MLGYGILDAESNEDIDTLFSLMEGEMPLTAARQFSPNSSLLEDYIPSHNPEEWCSCKSWVAWWKRPAHLSKLQRVLLVFLIDQDVLYSLYVFAGLCSLSPRTNNFVIVLKVSFLLL